MQRNELLRRIQSYYNLVSLFHVVLFENIFVGWIFQSIDIPKCPCLGGEILDIWTSVIPSQEDQTENAGFYFMLELDICFVLTGSLFLMNIFVHEVSPCIRMIYSG